VTLSGATKTLAKLYHHNYLPLGPNSRAEFTSGNAGLVPVRDGII
jgi:hypothetical protein